MDTIERLNNNKYYSRHSLVAQESAYQCLPMQETWFQSLAGKDPLEKEMAISSSILAWRIPMDRGAWRPTVHGVAKELGVT